MNNNLSDKRVIRLILIMLFVLIGFLLILGHIRHKYLYSIDEVFESLGYEVKREENSKEILIEKDNKIYYKFSRKNSPMKYILIDNKAYVNQDDLKKITLTLDDKYKNDILIPLSNQSNRNKDDAPIFSYINDNKISICDYNENKTYYIMFLASWCPHCKNIIDNIDKLNIIQNNQELIIINIDNKKSEDKNKRILNDPDKKLFKAFNGEYVPSVFKIEHEKIIDKYIGEEEVVSLLEKIK